MTLKPTIINGEWVYAPPPSQDAKWLKAHPQHEPSTPEHQASEAFMMLAALVVAFPLIFIAADWLRYGAGQ